MQLMPDLSKQFNIDPFDPEMNIKVGTQYFADLLAKYQRIDYALAAYNAGPGNVDKYGGIPPFPETQNYVSKILAGVARLEASN
ncbi:lytic murein transglycosylase [compost metagenome]